MIVIRVEDAHCTLVSGKSGKITPALRFHNPKAHFDPRQSPVVKLYNKETRQFPSGLLPRVLDRLSRRKVPYRLIKPERAPIKLDNIRDDCLHDVVLRGYQLSSVKAGIKAERGIFDIATNGGKTEIMSGLAATLIENAGIRGTVIVPNNGLLIQTAERLHKRCGVTVGMLGAGRRTTGQITVATIQTLASRLGYISEETQLKSYRKGKKTKSRKVDPATLKLLKRSGFVFVDEAHHASSASYAYVLSLCPARFRFGFTGSKRGGKLKQAQMEAYLGPTLKKISNDFLMKKGHSATALVFLITAKSMFKTKIRAPQQTRKRRRNSITGLWEMITAEPTYLEQQQHESKTLLKDDIYNNKLLQIVDAQVAGGFKPLILTSSIAHLELLQKKCAERELLPLSIWGDVPVAEREKHKATFIKKRRGVLIGSTVFDEGQDVPAIGALTLASGGQSVRQLLQRTGRSFRAKKEGLNAVMIVDPHPTHAKYVERHSLARLALYRAEGYKIFKIKNVKDFCEKVKQGWPALLGQELYSKLLEEQRKRSNG